MNSDDILDLIAKNSTVNPVNPKKEMKSGYDLPVYGIGNETFYAIHIPAIICIVSSFTCAVIAITLSFKRQSYSHFFTKWSKSDRFIVYMALCDGLFNVSHFTDHMHIVIVKNHVYPKELCEFYGFTLAVFITSQNLCVNIVALNAFLLMYFNKNLNFGRWDWKLLVWTFGVPFLGATISAIAGQLGPNGSFCYFDGIKGNVANICFTTVPLLIILVLNTVLYILTWKRIREQTETVKQNFGTMSASMRASHRAAKAMSLFVVAFFIQWWAMAFYGFWQLIDENVPQPIHHLVTTFSNIGGCLNLGVYIILRRRQLQKGEIISTEVKSDKHTHSVVPATEASMLESQTTPEQNRNQNFLSPRWNLP